MASLDDVALDPFEPGDQLILPQCPETHPCVDGPRQGLVDHLLRIDLCSILGDRSEREPSSADIREAFQGICSQGSVVGH